MTTDKTREYWEEDFIEQMNKPAFLFTNKAKWMRDYVKSLLHQSNERLLGEIEKKIPKKRSIKKVHDFYKPRTENKKNGIRNTMAYDYSAGMVNGRNQTIDEITKALSDVRKLIQK